MCTQSCLNFLPTNVPKWEHRFVIFLWEIHINGSATFRSDVILLATVFQKLCHPFSTYIEFTDFVSLEVLREL